MIRMKPLLFLLVLMTFACEKETEASTCASLEAEARTSCEECESTGQSTFLQSKVYHTGPALPPLIANDSTLNSDYTSIISWLTHLPLAYVEVTNTCGDHPIGYLVHEIIQTNYQEYKTSYIYRAGTWHSKADLEEEAYYRIEWDSTLTAL